MTVLFLLGILLAEANLLFLESPVGVGFSYTNTSSDLTNLDDDFAGNYNPRNANTFYENSLRCVYAANL